MKDIYLYLKKDLSNIPAGSKVKLSDTMGIYYAVIYDQKWYGYYHYSLFFM